MSQQYIMPSMKAYQMIRTYCKLNNISIRLESRLRDTYNTIVSFISKRGRTEFKVRQVKIAEKLELTREWVCKLISHLENSGVLVKEKPVSIKNIYENFFCYILPCQVEMYKDYLENKGKLDQQNDNITSSSSSNSNKSINIPKTKTSSFNFKGRGYNSDNLNDLKRKLLGWDKYD